jgi:hypothetical protein
MSVWEEEEEEKEQVSSGRLQKEKEFNRKHFNLWCNFFRKAHHDGKLTRDRTRKFVKWMDRHSQQKKRRLYRCPVMSIETTNAEVFLISRELLSFYALNQDTSSVAKGWVTRLMMLPDHRLCDRL